jgi:hypothetical protein
MSLFVNGAVFLRPGGASGAPVDPPFGLVVILVILGILLLSGAGMRAYELARRWYRDELKKTAGTSRGRMSEHNKGDPSVNDPRVLEQFFLFDPSIGTMGGWTYSQAKLQEHAELIARNVLEWSPGRHWHDALGNCQSTESLLALFEHPGDLLDALTIVHTLSLSIEYDHLEKSDPLHKKYHSLHKVTINGHVGRSTNDWQQALWHALLNWAEKDTPDVD